MNAQFVSILRTWSQQFAYIAVRCVHRAVTEISTSSGQAINAKGLATIKCDICFRSTNKNVTNPLYLQILC